MSLSAMETLHSQKYVTSCQKSMLVVVLAKPHLTLSADHHES